VGTVLPVRLHGLGHEDSAGGGVAVRRIPILVEDLIKNGYAFLEGRQVREGDRKVTRKFVSVAPFLRDVSPNDRDMWWEGQTQTKSQRAHWKKGA
jgi:hypothetical protein